MRILVVDDEPLICKGIISMIRRSSAADSATVEYALSAAEATDKLEKRRFDLLFTDIRMPGADGFSLLETAAHRDPEMRCVVISGFDDFNYARRALRLKADDYLLKPVRIEELELILSAAMEAIDERGGARDNKDLLLDAVLSRLVHIDPAPGGERTVLLKELVGLAPGPFARMFLCDIAVPDIGAHLRGLDPDGSVTALSYDRISRLYILVANSAVADSAAIGAAVRCVGKGENGSVIVSDTVSVFDISSALMDTLIAARRRRILEPPVFRSSAADRTAEDAPEPLMKAVDALKARRDEAAVADLIDHIRKAGAGGAAVAPLAELYAELSGKDDFEAIPTLEEYGQRLRSAVCRSALGSADDSSIRTPIERAIAYMTANFHRDISLASVSNEIDLDYYYFSKLFKESVGRTFTEELTRLRCGYARELLSSTALSIEAVGARVGYRSAKQFIEAFKRSAGTSPGRYRKSADS